MGPLPTSLPWAFDLPVALKKGHRTLGFEQPHSWFDALMSPP